jgi:hypothetical protein
MLSRTIAVACALALLPAAATAQSLPVEPRVTLTPDVTAVVDAPRQIGADHQPKALHRKDSLWNGVIIGAGLGALAGTLISFAVTDCSECAGFNVPLTFGVLGAGAGAGIGAGIDAWRQNRAPVTIAPTRHTRLVVSPVLGKYVRGVVASIRF